MDELDNKIKEILSKKIEVPKSFTYSIENALKDKKRVTKNKILKVATILTTVILTIGTVSTIYAHIKWEIEYNQFINRKIQYGYTTIQEAVDDGYEQNIDMEYIYQDGIGVKLDSLMITDDYFFMKLDFDFEKELIFDSNAMTYGYAIYDENDNIYGVYEPMPDYRQYLKKLCRELKLNKGITLSNTQSGANVIKYQDNNMVTTSEMTSNVGFPKSKKIYIRIFGLGYQIFNNNGTKINIEKINISDAEWILEINVPEKFYERETTKLKLKENIQGVNVEKIELTETSLTMNIQMQELNELIMKGRESSAEELNEFFQEIYDKLYITDGENNKYFCNKKIVTNNSNGVSVVFEISKKELNKRLYLNVKFDDITQKVELIVNN